MFLSSQISYFCVIAFSWNFAKPNWERKQEQDSFQEFNSTIYNSIILIFLTEIYKHDLEIYFHFQRLKEKWWLEGKNKKGWAKNQKSETLFLVLRDSNQII